MEQLLYTEQELAASKGREKALQDQLLKEVTDSQDRLRKYIQLNTELQAKLQNETNLRIQAESHAASAQEKATSLEGKLGHLSETIEREKKRLHDDHSQLKKDSKFSISRITANVSCQCSGQCLFISINHSSTCIFFFCCSLNK